MQFLKSSGKKYTVIFNSPVPHHSNPSDTTGSFFQNGTSKIAPEAPHAATGNGSGNASGSGGERSNGSNKPPSFEEKLKARQEEVSRSLEPAAKEEVVEHAGGCHCKAVRFRVRAPRHLIAWDCNCSICHMKRNTHFIVPASDFFLDEGEDNLSEYRFGTGVARHRFCKICGVQAFYHPRSNPDGVAVTVHCLDPGTVASVEVRKFDGTDWGASYAATGNAACSKKASS